MADIVEVTSGVSDGQQVVRTGHQKLYDGAKVAPVTFEKADAPAVGANQ